MAGSKFSLPLIKRAGSDPEARAVAFAPMLAPTHLRVREVAVNLANDPAERGAAESDLLATFAQNQDIAGILFSVQKPA